MSLSLLIVENGQNQINYKIIYIIFVLSLYGASLLPVPRMYRNLGVIPG